MRTVLLNAILLASCSDSADTGGETGVQGGVDSSSPPSDGGIEDGAVAADSGWDAGAATDDAGADSNNPADVASPSDGSFDGGRDASHPSDGSDQSDASADSGLDAGIVADAGGDGSADAGTDGGTGWSGTFDMGFIRDPSTAQCAFSNHRTTIKDGVSVDVWNVTYYSWESIGGTLSPILIRAFASKPVSAGSNLPGVVQAHGLGGFAKEENATGPAALLDMFVIAYTGPGGGDAADNTSEGLPAEYNNGYRMFDTLADVRGSWFWAHAVAAMRALTCLETRQEVDRTRLGMTGFSAGGVVTLISSGADDRVKASVPLSGTGAWDVATQSPDAWQHKLLAQAGLTLSSPEWQKLMVELIAPAVMVGGTTAKVLMCDGSTDEFFPLTAYMATFDAIPGTDKRSSIAANFDHGCYSVSGVEDKQTIEDRASLRSSGGQRMWFSHWFGTDSNYSYVPAAPQVSVTPAGGGMYIMAVVDGGGAALDIEEVRAWASNDDSFIYASATLDESGGVWQKLVAFPLQANTIYFVDVQYKTKDLFFPERFSITSPPAIPQGLIPHIRSMDNCL